MRIICDTQILTEACLNVARCVPSKAAMPHLECILLQADDRGLKLSGFDLDLGIDTCIPVRVGREGAAVLNAKMLCDILRGITLFEQR